MTTVTPLVSPPLDDIRNAAQIALGYRQGSPLFGRQVMADIERIARLLQRAIESLSEPNLAAMQAGEILLKEWSGTPEPQRQLRDTLAGILNAQISGVVPKTWEVS